MSEGTTLLTSSETYKPLGEDEVNKLARDYIGGQVFTMLDIDADDDLEKGVRMIEIFMPLAVGGHVAMREVLARTDDEMGLAYEYLRYSVGTNNDGYPVFSTMRILSMKDTRKFRDKVIELQEAIDKIAPVPEEYEKADSPADDGGVWMRNSDPTAN